MKSCIPSRRARVAEPVRAAIHEFFQPLEARLLMAVGLDAKGWTTVTPSSDTKTIYVSSSSGSDSNDGSSPADAVKTIDKGVSLLRSGAPDHLLLKKGDTFTSGFDNWLKSGRSAQEPLLISSYGSDGERPYLKTGAGPGFFSTTAFHDVAIIGLRFEANTRNPDSADFVGPAGRYGIQAIGPINGLLVEDSSFSHYVYNASITGYSGYSKNVKIRRSAFTDSWAVNDKAVGFYSSNTEGMLIEGNLFDHNGWNEKTAGGSDHLSHNVYLWESTRNPIIRDNIFANAGQHGLQARGGGTIENNLFLKNPIALLVGNGSTVRAGGVTAKVSGNVFLDSRSMHGAPRGWAIELGNIKPGGGSYVRDNIIANDSQLRHAAIKLETATIATNAADGTGVSDLTIENNIIYDWYQGISLGSKLVSGGAGQTGLNGLVVRNNDIQKMSSGRMVYHPQAYDSGSEDWSDNRYHDSSSSSGWFYLDGKPTSYDTWDTAVEATPQDVAMKYPDPERDIAKYSKSVGAAASLNGFLAEVRKQNKENWRQPFTAAAAESYIRAGFTGVTPDGPPPPPTDVPPGSSEDVTPPSVVWSKFDASTQTITMKFSEDVSRSLNTSDLRLKNTKDNTLIPYDVMKMSYDRATNTATWSFRQDVPAADYKVMLSWHVVEDAAGNNLDGNHDGSSGPDHVMYIAAAEIAGVSTTAIATT
ncbi:MAG: hypothetical protein QOF78_2045 [Phycisphaerales bacterium]|nr:hypothetical protein [Phycisphaerales bacterium]